LGKSLAYAEHPAKGCGFYSYSWFEPQGGYSTHVTVPVPKDQFDVVQLTAELVTAKAGALEIEHPDQPSLGPRREHQESPNRISYVLTEWPLHETSLLRRLTRGPRGVRSFLIFNDSSRPRGVFPQLFIDIASKDATANVDVSKRYFLRYHAAVAEIALKSGT
jgi:hypothetical protein